MPSAWNMMFGGDDPAPNRAQRRQEDRELKRMMRRSRRAYARSQRQIEAMRPKEETDAEA